MKPRPRPEGGAMHQTGGMVDSMVKEDHMVTETYPPIDVERYWRDGYLTAPSVLTPGQLAEMRAEADRLTALCAAEPERYRHRIQWERDYLDREHQAGMEQVIRKLEPISDLSPIFAELAFFPSITGPVGALF